MKGLFVCLWPLCQILNVLYEPFEGTWLLPERVKPCKTQETCARHFIEKLVTV